MWLVVTHLAVFALGYITCHLLALWEGRRVLTNDGETPMNEHPKHSMSSVPGWVLILVGAAVLMVGLGIQQVQFQRDADRRAEEAQRIDVCYEKWGRDMIETLDRRISATGKVEAANTVKGNALDRIILVVAALRNDPPAADERDLDRSLEQFIEAKQRLDMVKAEAEVTRVNNPFPVLNCRP